MRYFTRLTAPALVALSLALAPQSGVAETLALQDPVAVESLSKSKQTKPGLYITAAEAARVLAENDKAALIDVRTPSEIMLIGYATPTAAAIPANFVNPEIAESSGGDVYTMVSNPEFETEVKAWLESGAGRDLEVLLVTCRSGSRSAAAIDRLVAAGVDLPLYSVIDGFEGDKNADGARAVNGWRNAGLPWTYKIREGLWPGHN